MGWAEILKYIGKFMTTNSIAYLGNGNMNSLSKYIFNKKK
jgi:hypothetical protein